MQIYGRVFEDVDFYLVLLRIELDLVYQRFRQDGAEFVVRFFRPSFHLGIQDSLPSLPTVHFRMLSLMSDERTLRWRTSLRPYKHERVLRPSCVPTPPPNPPGSTHSMTRRKAAALLAHPKERDFFCLLLPVVRIILRKGEHDETLTRNCNWCPDHWTRSSTRISGRRSRQTGTRRRLGDTLRWEKSRGLQHDRRCELAVGRRHCAGQQRQWFSRHQGLLYGLRTEGRVLGRRRCQQRHLYSLRKSAANHRHECLRGEYIRQASRPLLRNRRSSRCRRATRGSKTRRQVE